MPASLYNCPRPGPPPTCSLPPLPCSTVSVPLLEPEPWVLFDVPVIPVSAAPEPWILYELPPRKDPERSPPLTSHCWRRATCSNYAKTFLDAAVWSSSSSKDVSVGSFESALRLGCEAAVELKLRRRSSDAVGIIIPGVVLGMHGGGIWFRIRARFYFDLDLGIHMVVRMVCTSGYSSTFALVICMVVKLVRDWGWFLFGASRHRLTTTQFQLIECSSHLHIFFLMLDRSYFTFCHRVTLK
ncbi:hypothetical protein R3P38DRAFT_3343275 [Favolaschia claudopus]|uniref:Uncharacterized protein n=1 Tax=Favolaschia claudopus TaxID=2862362 RepID=A0AAW0DR21_9AGAR